MAERGSFDEALAARLPLPLAQLYRRANNAKTARDAHDCAVYLWEAAIKLLASAAIARFKSEGEPNTAIAEKLKNLARPSLGHWREFLRLVIPALAHFDAYSAIATLLDDHCAELPRCAALDTLLRATHKAGEGRRLADLFDRVVRQRNDYVGHGAAANLPPETLRPIADALLAAAAELFARLDVLAGRQLIAVTEIRPVRTTWLMERSELRGIAPWRIASLELPRTDDAVPILSEGLYLVDPARPEDPAGYLALRPLIDYDAERETVRYLNGRRGKNFEMLCYTTGERHSVPGDSHSEHAVPIELPAMDDPASASPGAKCIGDYELLSELGRGNMGIVYRARQISLGRDVALKVQPRPNDPKADARFRREIRALARVDHPNVVKVFTSGVEGEQFYYTMELLEGAPLTAVSDALTRADSGTAVDLPEWQEALNEACLGAKRGELPPGWPLMSSGETANVSYAPGPERFNSRAPARDYVRRIVTLGRQIADAVHALHETGVLHRDIKPGNIQVAPDGSEAVLLDLGLAQLADDVEGRLTRTTQFVGTRRYASPEQQIDARSLDRRADVYSLGATLWELIALRPLFDATDATPLPELIARVQRDEPVRLRSIAPAIGRDLEAIVHKCLEKRPEHRYSSARELALDLQRVLDGEPVTARPVGSLDRALKWVRRRPIVSGLTATLAIVTLLGASGVLWKWQEAVDQRVVAQRNERRALDSEVLERAARQDVERSSYFTSIALVGRELQAANVDRARRALANCPLRLRQWEWHLFDRACNDSARTLTGHNGPVTTVAFSPDGKWLASGGRDQTLRVWNMADGSHRTFPGHNAAVRRVIFRPDGKQIASASLDNTVRIWDLASGQMLRKFDRHTDDVVDVSYHPMGKTIASAGSDGKILIWSPDQPDKKPNELATGAKVEAVAFSPDRRWLAGASDSEIAVWDLESGGIRYRLKDLAGPGGGTNSFRYQRADSSGVAFSADGSKLVSVGQQSLVKIWNLTGQDPTGYGLFGHTSGIAGVSVPLEGDLFATAGWDRTLRIWSLLRGVEQLPVTLRGHSALPRCVAMRPAGGLVASGDDDGKILVWDLRGRGPADFGELLGLMPTEGVDVAFHSDGQKLATAGWHLKKTGEGQAVTEGEIRIWDLAAREREPRLLHGHAGHALGVAFQPRGALVASCGDDGAIRVWDLAEDRDHFTLNGHEGAVYGIAFYPDGQRLVSGGNDGTVRLWDVAGRKELGVWQGHEHIVKAVAVSQDGKLVGSASTDETVRLWSADGKLQRVLTGHSGPVASLSFSRSGQILASAGSDGVVRLWDTVTGALLGELRGHSGPVFKVDFDSSGSRLVSGGGNSTIPGELIVWDVERRAEVLKLAGHQGPVAGVAFSPDGLMMASVGFASLQNGEVYLWNGRPRSLSNAP